MFVKLTRIDRNGTLSETYVNASYVVRVDKPVWSEGGIGAVIHTLDTGTLDVTENASTVSRRLAEAQYSHLSGLGRAVWTGGREEEGHDD